MGVWTKNGFLYLGFTCYDPEGHKLRCQEATKLKDTKGNWALMRSKHKAIQYELKLGRFDYLRHFPRGSKAHLFKADSADMTLAAWWDKWISEKTLRPSTAKNWASSYFHHIGPQLGHLALRKVDEHEILVFRKILLLKSLKANTINDKIMGPLRMALWASYRRGLIKTYPCASIRPLPESPVDIDPYSFDELEFLKDKLWAKKLHMEHDLVAFWANTGLRVGELCALRWEHVDWHNSKVMIRQTMHTNGTIGPTKTVTSNRDVDINQVAFEALKRQEERTGLSGCWIWQSQKWGAPYFTDEKLRKRFRFMLRLVGLKWRAPEQLRHTFATLAIGSGENIKWVSKTLGHSNEQITVKRYSRFIPNLTHRDGSLLVKNQENRRGEKGAEDEANGSK